MNDRKSALRSSGSFKPQVPSSPLSLSVELPRRRASLAVSGGVSVGVSPPSASPPPTSTTTSTSSRPPSPNVRGKGMLKTKTGVSGMGIGMDNKGKGRRASLAMSGLRNRRLSLQVGDSRGWSGRPGSPNISPNIRPSRAFTGKDSGSGDVSSIAGDKRFSSPGGRQLSSSAATPNEPSVPSWRKLVQTRTTVTPPTDPSDGISLAQSGAIAVDSSTSSPMKLADGELDVVDSTSFHLAASTATDSDDIRQDVPTDKGKDHDNQSLSVNVKVGQLQSQNRPASSHGLGGIGSIFGLGRPQSPLGKRPGSSHSVRSFGHGQGQGTHGHLPHSFLRPHSPARPRETGMDGDGQHGNEGDHDEHDHEQDAEEEEDSASISINLEVKYESNSVSESTCFVFSRPMTDHDKLSEFISGPSTLESIPDSFFKQANLLTHLDISNIKLRHLPCVVLWDNCPKLSTLIASMNLLNDWEEIMDLQDFPSLKRLDISANPLPFIDQRLLLIEKMLFPSVLDHERDVGASTLTTKVKIQDKLKASSLSVSVGGDTREEDLNRNREKEKEKAKEKDSQNHAGSSATAVKQRRIPIRRCVQSMQARSKSVQNSNVSNVEICEIPKAPELARFSTTTTHTTNTSTNSNEMVNILSLDSDDVSVDGYVFGFGNDDAIDGNDDGGDTGSDVFSHMHMNGVGGELYKPSTATASTASSNRSRMRTRMKHRYRQKLRKEREKEVNVLDRLCDTPRRSGVFVHLQFLNGQPISQREVNLAQEERRKDMINHKIHQLSESPAYSHGKQYKRRAAASLSDAIKATQAGWRTVDELGASGGHMQGMMGILGTGSGSGGGGEMYDGSGNTGNQNASASASANSGPKPRHRETPASKAVDEYLKHHHSTAQAARKDRELNELTRQVIRHGRLSDFSDRGISVGPKARAEARARIGLKAKPSENEKDKDKDKPRSRSKLGDGKSKSKDAEINLDLTDTDADADSNSDSGSSDSDSNSDDESYNDILLGLHQIDLASERQAIQSAAIAVQSLYDRAEQLAESGAGGDSEFLRNKLRNSRNRANAGAESTSTSHTATATAANNDSSNSPSSATDISAWKDLLENSENPEEIEAVFDRLRILDHLDESGLGADRRLGGYSWRNVLMEQAQIERELKIKEENKDMSRRLNRIRNRLTSAILDPKSIYKKNKVVVDLAMVMTQVLKEDLATAHPTKMDDEKEREKKEKKMGESEAHAPHTALPYPRQPGPKKEIDEAWVERRLTAARKKNHMSDEHDATLQLIKRELEYENRRHDPSYQALLFLRSLHEEDSHGAVFIGGEKIEYSPAVRKMVESRKKEQMQQQWADEAAGVGGGVGGSTTSKKHSGGHGGSSGAGRSRLRREVDIASLVAQAKARKSQMSDEDWKELMEKFSASTGGRKPGKKLSQNAPELTEFLTRATDARTAQDALIRRE